MYAGQIVEMGPVDALFHEPSHPYTRRLFASTPDLTGTRAVATIPGAPPRLDEPPPGCPFEPRCDRRMDVAGHAPPRLLPVRDTSPPAT